MATDGWVPTKRDGLIGLVYEPSKNRGIDMRGAKGKMCFNVNVKIPGGYYFTALSYAPHNTEHNDMWVESSLGFELWKGGKNGTLGGVVKPTEWRKAYQNYGIRGISDDLKTIDFNGHRFIIPVVNSDAGFQVCVSGRSYRYEVFRLILVKCKGVVCTGGAWVLHDLRERPLSTCV